MKYIYAELRAIWLDNYVFDKYIDAYLDMEFDYDEDNDDVVES